MKELTQFRKYLTEGRLYENESSSDETTPQNDIASITSDMDIMYFYEDEIEKQEYGGGYQFDIKWKGDTVTFRVILSKEGNPELEELEIVEVVNPQGDDIDLSDEEEMEAIKYVTPGVEDTIEDILYEYK